MLGIGCAPHLVHCRYLLLLARRAPGAVNGKEVTNLLASPGVSGKPHSCLPAVGSHQSYLLLLAVVGSECL